MFVFHNPLEERHLKKTGKQLKNITFELAMEEIRKHTEVSTDGKTSVLSTRHPSVNEVVHTIQ